MGFLKRLLGGSGEQPSSGTSWSSKAATGMTLDVNCFLRIRPDAMLDIVGEAHRQQLVRLARTPMASDLPPGVPSPPAGYYKAMLIPEPTNPYDANAVAVALWAVNTWALGGYLSRENAVLYQPLFRHLGRNGKQPGIVCDAALTSERGGTGVVLHLGTPGECMVELITDDRLPAAHPWVGQLVAFTGDLRTTITGCLVDRHAQVMVARWAGCEVMPRVTKKTQLLVAADTTDLTANMQKARDYGIPIEGEAQFLAAIGLPPEAIGRDDLAWARQ